MNGYEIQEGTVSRGSAFKGLFVAVLCQVAYLLIISQLGDDTQRNFGFMFFALVQFFYLLPMAYRYHHRGQRNTAGGVVLAGALGLVASAGYFAYLVLHGRMPSFAGLG